MNTTLGRWLWTIWLAASISSPVRLTERARASDPAAARPSKTIVVLGDSLAAGLGLDPDQAFPALLQERIDAAGLDCKVVNAGVSGDTTAGGLRRLNWLLRQKVDILIVELGGNDGLRGIQPESTQANLQAMIDQARKKYPDIRIILAGMRLPPNLGAEYLQEFERIFPTLAEKNAAALVPFLLEGVGGERNLNQSDGIHPTAEGQRIVADNVWRVLAPLLGVALEPSH